MIFLLASVSGIWLYGHQHPSAPAFSDQIIVYMRSGTTTADLDHIVAAVHGRYVRPLAIPLGPAWLLEVPWASNAADTQKALNIILAIPTVQSAEVNSYAIPCGPTGPC